MNKNLLINKSIRISGLTFLFFFATLSISAKDNKIEQNVTEKCVNCCQCNTSVKNESVNNTDNPENYVSLSPEEKEDLANYYADLAEKSYKSKDYNKACEEVIKALKFNPQNKQAKTIYKNLKILGLFDDGPR